MNRAELIDFMVEQSHSKHSHDKSLTKADADRALTWVTESIINALNPKKGKQQNISLVGFGTFKIQHREQREGRNPQTGTTITIPAYKQLVFRVGSKMKEACNS